MKFRVLPKARQDIRRLHAFLLVRNPLAAEKAAEVIKGAFVHLQENPRIGFAVEGRPRDRQFLIPFGSSAYILRYTIDEAADTLFVTRIWHGREERQ